MSPVPSPESPAPALSAFLRGVERRGLVLAWLQCGDLHTAEDSVAVAFRAFRAAAARDVMAGWPVRFWGLLVAVPALRMAMPTAVPAGFTMLAPLAPADRLALLLRIVAGLDEPMASDVLGIDEDGYRQALARACPRDARGQPDALAWRTLAEAAQQQVRDLPGERLARLAQLRDAALAPQPPAAPGDGVPKPPAPVSRRAPVSPRSRRRGPRWARWLAVGGVLVLGGLAGWHWIERPPALPPEPVSQALPGALHVVDAAPALVEDLPASTAEPGPAPAPAIDPADAAMLADPELDTARDADFYAWLAAGAPMPKDDADPRPASASSDAPGLETVDDEN